jgi:CubicO group peptidase (beta-lactamase class C family)
MIYPPIEGEVAPGFEPVADVFRHNFRHRREVGAAVAVYRGQERLVDLWGGVADAATHAPWKRDTTLIVFSTTKGMAGLAMALAHSRGLFDHDALVARYWPEFAANGKADITVRQLLGHQAGLSAVDGPLTPEVLRDPERRDAVLARQRPAWAPGKYHGYHGLTLGFYEAALLRRCDPRGRGVGAYFAEEIAAPLGLDFWIGLPATFDTSRMARIGGFHKSELLLHPNTVPPRFALAMVLPWSLSSRSFNNPRITTPQMLDAPEYWRLEFPASTGVGEVRAIARAYAEFATGGRRLGLSPGTLAELARTPLPPTGGDRDQVLHTECAFSLGFLKPFPELRFGNSGSAFGTPGAGGSFGFADPDLGIGFAYAPNRMGFHLFDDPRERALREAVYACLARTGMAASPATTAQGAAR